MIQPSEIQQTLAKIMLGQETSDTHQPSGKVEVAEKVIGTLEDPIARSLYSYSMRLFALCEDLQATFSGEVSAEDRAKNVAELTVYVGLCQLANIAFATRLMELYPVAANLDVACNLRENWQVVIWKKERKPETHTIAIDVTELFMEELRKKKDSAAKK